MNHLTRIRYWLKSLLCWVVVPILGGPSKGAWFGLFTGTRFIRGTYGPEESAILARLLSPGNVVLDVGAHVGYFTLLASRVVGSRGKVIAFEPLQVNLAYLNTHRRVNRLSNVDVLPFAVGGCEGQMSFDLRSGTGRGRLSVTDAAGQQAVRVVVLDTMFKRGELPRVDLLKMDVEGAEGEALRGASNLLLRCRPTIVLSLHGPKAKSECRAEVAPRGRTVRASRRIGRRSGSLADRLAKTCLVPVRSIQPVLGTGSLGVAEAGQSEVRTGSVE